MAAHRAPRRRAAALGTLLPLLAASAASADHAIRFDDVARYPETGLRYGRVPSTTDAAYDRLKALPVYGMPQIVATPEKPRGAPGVAIFDIDRDGDLDIYVTNGPGAANSLFSNRLAETGKLGFVDVAVKAGVDATAQDSTGVCYGDLDNDADQDLLVLGRSEGNRLFQNHGDGMFADVTAQSGLDGGSLAHTACSMGDVDGDGLLDVVVANTFDWSERSAILSEPYASSQHNQLYLNVGGNRFVDVSESSGIRNLTGFVPPADGSPTITWAIAMVDYDLDGDLDVLQADDQGRSRRRKRRAGSSTCSKTTAVAASPMSPPAWVSPSPGSGWGSRSATSTATAGSTSSPPTWGTTPSRRWGSRCRAAP